MKTGLTNCQARIDALNAGEQFYEAGKPCRNGHLSKRYTKGGGCFECSKGYVNFSKKVKTALADKDQMSRSIQTSVYVFVAGDFVKIGVAENPGIRLQVTRTHCPMPVALVYSTPQMPRPEATRIERACFEALKDKWAIGEWFQTDGASAIKVLLSVV